MVLDRGAFFDSLIVTFLIKNNDLFIIQIGANDGKMADPIYEFVTSNRKIVRGILIEPVKDYFEELKTKNLYLTGKFTPLQYKHIQLRQEMLTILYGPWYQQEF